MLSESEFRLCEVGYEYTTRDNERRFHRGEYILCEEVGNFAASHNFRSTFCSAYRYNSSELEKASLFGDLYLDLDDENNFENVREDAKAVLSYFKIVYKIDPTDIDIYFSGKKGLHMIVPAHILGIEPDPHLNEIFKYIVSSISGYTPHKTVDLKIYDNRRLFRIPNTIHGDTGLYKVPLTVDEIMHASIDEIRTKAMSPVAKIRVKEYETNNTAKKTYQSAVEECAKVMKEMRKDKRYNMSINFIPPCIQHILDEGASVGQRNITIACLTGFYKAYGKSMNETIDIISEWNSKNQSPTGMSELKRTVQSMFSGQKMFGCSTISTLTTCDPANCRFGNRRNNGQRQSEDQTDPGRRLPPYKR